MPDEKKPDPTRRADYIPPRAKDVFLSSAVVDNMMSSMIALGSEFWALQKRMNVMETLLEKNGSVSRTMVEGYRPTEAETAAWEEQRDRFIKRVYGFLENTNTDTTKPG